VLFTTSDVSIGGARARTRIMLERRFRCQMLDHEHLIFDSKYMAPAKDKGPKVVNLYLVREGTVRLDDGTVLTAPVALGLAGDEFDRVEPTSRSFRTEGPRVFAVNIRIQADDCLQPLRLADGPRALPAEVWDAIAGFDVAFDDAACEAGVRALLTALERAGVVAATPRESITAKENGALRALWSAVSPLYGRIDSLASMGEVEAATGASLRQLGRDLPALAATFGLLGGGFREAFKVLRLRLAGLLLGAPDTTASEVARVVGYANLDAMGQAFRQSGLPSPGELRARLLGRSTATSDSTPAAG
jgi:AraC-like DNA-binding protein